RAFLKFARRANFRKAHFCVRNAHAKMGTSAYPKLRFFSVLDPIKTQTLKPYAVHVAGDTRL
ncbi:hypothetical protein ACQ4M4_28105, partial [Leptolyngbya sp. AN02str]|uniref:hypothetical protein n=1 Tax=Leptolyngbya sp. AN02str TaxID=3423363 RepID=UPI003D31239E